MEHRFRVEREMPALFHQAFFIDAAAQLSAICEASHAIRIHGNVCFDLRTLSRLARGRPECASTRAAHTECGRPGNADRQGATRQEMDGRAAHRQLQGADRQAGDQTEVERLPPHSHGMIGLRQMHSADNHRTAIGACLISTLLIALACCRALADEPALTPASLARIGEVDERFQSYNVEMVEVTGGRFWKPYGPHTSNSRSDLFAYRSPIDL